MSAFFQLIIGKIVGLVDWFGQLFVAVFVAVWDLLKDLMAWTFESFLQVAVSAVGAIDLSAFNAYENPWGNLPSQILNGLSVLRVPEAAAIILAAIGIRLVLQLIPFTRLGS